MGTSPLSFGGLATGLDTQQMISELMRAERAPLRRYEQQREQLGEADEAWGDLTTRYSALRSAVDALAEPAAFDDFVRSSSSNEDAVGATVTGSPQPGSVTLTIDQLARAHQLAHATTYDSPEDTVANGQGELTVTRDGEPYTVEVDEDTTLAELAIELNDLNGGFSAQVLRVEEGTYRLVLSADGTGNANELEITNTPPGFADDFDELQAAQDAELILGSGGDAITVTRQSNTVNDLIDGVSLELRQAGEEVTITTARDHDAAVEAVSEFVSRINQVLDRVAHHTRFDPETEESGALSGERAARQLASELRAALSEAIEGDEGDLVLASQVGITLNRDGRVDFDEGELRAQLAEDFDAVRRLFAGDGENVVGVAGNVSETVALAEGPEGSIQRARDRVESRIDDLGARIEQFEDRLAQREARLTEQFIAMERAVSNLQQQAGFLGSLLGQE